MFISIMWLVGYLFSGKGGLNVELAKPAIAKSNAAKPEASEKPKVKVVEPSKGDEDDDTDSEDDESDDDDEDSEDISDEVSCLCLFEILLFAHSVIFL